MPKRPKAPSEPPKLRLSGFAPAIASLLALEVPAKRLAEIFSTQPNHIYVLAHRGRSMRSHVIEEDRGCHEATLAVSNLARDDGVLEATRALGIRAEEDGVQLTPRKARNLAWLESEMQRIVNHGRHEYKFLEAISALRALKPYIGYPSESSRLKLAAKLHQHLAWFYVHSGFTRSSIAESTKSIQLDALIYHNTEDPDALRELGDSCLILSHSHLLEANPQTALIALNLAREASLTAGIPLNLDYYRQVGVACFQVRQDERAKQMFSRTMESEIGATNEMTLRMAGERHLNLIAKPFSRVDEELILLEDAKNMYGENSLEASMCVHWAAACALSTDSAKAHQLALELTQNNQKLADRFGHQATIAKLLPITIELPSKKRALWVRRALYYNAFRNR